jgi:hypothetical protein
MRHLSKKAICAFASAVMLCGASAIPANAATKTSKNISIGNSRYGTSAGRFEPSKVELERFKDLVKQSESNISLNRSEVLLYEGETTTITVNVGSETDIAKGNGTIMYQWYNENGAIEGATASSYTTGALGTYYCEVWNTNISNLNWKVAETSLSAKKSTSFNADALRAENSVTLNDTGDSAKAVLSANVVNSSANKRSIGTMVSKNITPSEKVKTEACVVKRPETLEITKQPVCGVIYNKNEGCELSAEASGGIKPYKYEWYRGNKNVGNYEKCKVYEEGDYYCKITDSHGKSVSSKHVQVNGILKIAYQPSRKIVLPSESENLYLYTKAVGGIAPYTYKWTRDGKDINVNSPGIYISDAGLYKCTITDAVGTKVTSEDITIYEPLTISLPRVTEQTTINAEVKGGTGKYTYSWQRMQGGNYSGERFYWVDANCNSSQLIVNDSDITDYHVERCGESHNDSFYGKYGHYVGYYDYNVYRCIVNTIDENGNVLKTVVSKEMHVEKRDYYKSGKFVEDDPRYMYPGSVPLY